MKLSLRYLSLAFAVLMLTSSLALADIRIQLVQGKRTVRDRVSFTLEVSHEANENPHYEKMPEFIQISATFAAPGSGTVSIDGTGVGRFDESASYNGERTQITYGRHVVTLQVSATVVVTSLVVFVRGGVPREVIGEGARAASAEPATESSVEGRIADLERRVKELESEVAALKRARRTP